MKGYVKTIIAGCVILGIGIAVLIVALGLNGWTFAPEFETREFTAENVNSSIKINLDAGNLKTEFYDGDRIAITYPVAKGWNTDISEKDGKLDFEGNKHRWFIFTWGVTIPDTVIKLPKGTAYNVEINLNAGTVALADGEYAEIKTHVNAGTFKANSLDCQNFNLTVNAGLAEIKTIDCEKLVCKVNAGKADFKSITSPESEIKVAAGAANLGFTGAKTEYDAVVNVSAGSCSGLETQSVAGGKRVSIDVSAGSASVTFAA